MLRKARNKKPSGYVIWQGLSLADNKTPIAVVMTGLKGHRSANQKTGHMVQVWILVDGKTYMDAMLDGSDHAICVSCLWRGILSKKAPKRERDERGRFKSIPQFSRKMKVCYVGAKAPQGISKVLRDRRYPAVSLDVAAELVRDEKVRLGAYGDPAVVPIFVWERLLQFAKGWTGYTHQWLWDFCHPDMRKYVMASADTAHQANLAQSKGWRTFRVKSAADPRLASEVTCPASAEAGYRLTCFGCQACEGGGGKLPQPARKSIVIDAHGSAATMSSYRKLLALQMN